MSQLESKPELVPHKKIERKEAKEKPEQQKQESSTRKTAETSTKRETKPENIEVKTKKLSSERQVQAQDKKPEVTGSRTKATALIEPEEQVKAQIVQLDESETIINIKSEQNDNLI